MLEQKHFGKIAAIPAVVWLNFSKAFMPKRLMQTGRFNFGVRVETSSNIQVAGWSLLRATASMWLCPS